LSIASLWGQRSTDFLLAHLVEASLGPPRRTRSVARGGFRRLGFYVTNLPGLRARHVCPCLGAGMPARPLTPERPRPHTPRFAPPGQARGAASPPACVGARPVSRACRRLAGGLVRSAGVGLASPRECPSMLKGPECLRWRPPGGATAMESPSPSP